MKFKTTSSGFVNAQVSNLIRGLANLTLTPKRLSATGPHTPWNPKPTSKGIPDRQNQPETPKPGTGQ